MIGLKIKSRPYIINKIMCNEVMSGAVKENHLQPFQSLLSDESSEFMLEAKSLQFSSSLLSP